MPCTDTCGVIMLYLSLLRLLNLVTNLFPSSIPSSTAGDDVVLVRRFLLKSSGAFWWPSGETKAQALPPDAHDEEELL